MIRPIIMTIAIVTLSGCGKAVCDYSVEEWQAAYGKPHRKLDLDHSGIVDGADFELRAERCDG